MNRTAAVLTATALALAGCAQSPGAIAPVSMGNAYAGLSCAAAAAERAAAAANLAALSSAQSGAVAGDAIGVLLLGVPVSSLTGGDKAGAIAAAKGQVLALDARLASCR